MDGLVEEARMSTYVAQRQMLPAIAEPIPHRSAWMARNSGAADMILQIE